MRENRTPGCVRGGWVTGSPTAMPAAPTNNSICAYLERGDVVADFHHNIFYYYRGTRQSNREREQQLENNTTKALINTLEHCNSSVAFKFLRWLDIVATSHIEFELQKATIGRGNVDNKSQRLLLGLVPFKDSYSNVSITSQGSSPSCHRNSRRCK